MLQTKRTLIRPIEPGDNHSIFAYRSDKQTNQFQGWVPETVKDVDDFIAKNPPEFNSPDSWFQLVIIEKESRQLIGDVGVHFLEDGNPQCELGITLNKDFQGKGYAVEVMKVLLGHLFNDLKQHRIFASVDPRNIPSVNLMENLGFRKEAHFKESLFFKNEWVDDVVYGMLAKEWKSNE